MSILIKNMKMPQNCGECPLYGHLSIHGNTFRFCRLTRMETRPMGRRDDCPLIEVPPHGRLVDIDEVDREYNKGYVHKIYDFSCFPTIIEAEDSFFNSLKRGLEQAINNDVREITIIEAEDDGYFTAEEQKLKWDVIYNKSQKTGININDIIESEGEDDSN